KNIIDKPLELGSINKPINSDVVSITINIPKRGQHRVGFIDFSNLFGGNI
ncbi:unnamed protein product, partial [marine sediment metagenome]